MSTVLIATIFLVAAAWVTVDAWGAFRAPQVLEWASIAPAFVLNLVAVVIDGGLWWEAPEARRPGALACRGSPGAPLRHQDVCRRPHRDRARARGEPARSLVPYLDPASSLVIAGVMVHSAWGILSDSVRDLLDVALDEGVQLQVLRCRLATHFEDYRIHGVRSRRAGSAMFIEVFLEFNPDRRMADVQSVIDDMRDAMRAIPGSFVSIVPITEDVNVRRGCGRSPRPPEPPGHCVSGRREHVASRATGLIGNDEDLRRTREMAGTLVRTWSLGPALTTDLDVVPDEVLSNIVLGSMGCATDGSRRSASRSRSSWTP